ncbi:Prephenate dehydratase [Desulfamplus magnetovallimortis]|uniref:Prephenate dehydratase n=1 Tax=Desulfamplus magnetovallimortis TaxID=1246637 RepID=A0A1W1H6Z0_9BACT|nr:3-deoxy-7-phosphoheptulonate synthase [Desulfamplus magnetovallimortis]SLM28233.1 Prephenate dehydratase [Desulfamplus magnetovallimortis]
MILVLDKSMTQVKKNQLKSILAEKGCMVHEPGGSGQNILGIIGKNSLTKEFFMAQDGVLDIVPISTAYKLVSRQMKKEDTVIRIGNVEVGGDRIAIIAGPCAVESREQAMTIAKEVKKYGATLFRGGAFKPRSSPYSFQGLEEEGLKILAEVREVTGLRIVTEITSPMHADLMFKYVDVIQIGARNMQNFELLKCAGRMGKPVVLKRGLASTIEEWLMSAEYIAAEGNPNIILCERGIRTFEPYTRNTLDLSAIPVLKQLTHLPVLIDPSHATGIREKVSPMARAAVAAGADGLMIEVHHKPEEALSDGPQSLYPKQFGRLVRDIYVIAPVVGKQLTHDYTGSAAAASHQRGYTQSNKEGKQVVYLGEVGTFSHKAASQYFGSDVTSYPAPTFRDIFENVKSGAADFGIIPIENSLAGSIHENYDLLLEYELNITGELSLRVIHNLIAHPDTKLEDIKQVLAPPPAFQQCRRFLDANPDIKIVPVNATGSAVKRIAESGIREDAAIGSIEAAEIFSMNVLEETIEDNPRNFTRFVVIEKKPVTEGVKNKSSIVFSTSNNPGALFEVMKVFSENQINLVKLESRPIHGKPWQYMFYADLEADMSDPEKNSVLEEIQKNTEFFRILGSYNCGSDRQME